MTTSLKEVQHVVRATRGLIHSDQHHPALRKRDVAVRESETAGELGSPRAKLDLGKNTLEKW